MVGQVSRCSKLKGKVRNHMRFYQKGWSGNKVFFTERFLPKGKDSNHKVFYQKGWSGNTVF